MNLDKLKNDFIAIKSENVWGRIIMAGMLLVIFLLSIIVFSEKTVVTMVPPGLDEAAQQHANKADAGIHKAWSMYLASTLGNVTPATAEFARSTIDPVLGPRIRDEALVMLDKQIDTIRRDQTSYSFEPREVQYDAATTTTYVVGRHFTHQAGKALPDRVNRTYEFRWNFVNYMPSLAFIDTYEGAPRLKD